MIIRTYQCVDCDLVFDVELDTGDAADPDCPRCAVPLEWRPGKFNIGGSPVAKAADITQDILENDYKMTNFKDNQREGDIAAIVKPWNPPIDPQLKNAVQGFFPGSPAGPPAMAAQTFLAGARAGAKGPSGMDMLNQAHKQGDLPKGFRVIARG